MKHFFTVTLSSPKIIPKRWLTMTLKVNFSATKLNFLTAAILVSILSCVYTGDFVCQCDKGAKNGDTFIGVWNSPTGGCQKNFSVKIDLEDYKIRANPHQTWNGKEVVVFYNAQLGYYPYFTNADGTRSYNGGMPQVCLKSKRSTVVHACCSWSDQFFGQYFLFTLKHLTVKITS